MNNVEGDLRRRSRGRAKGRFPLVSLAALVLLLSILLYLGLRIANDPRESGISESQSEPYQTDHQTSSEDPRLESAWEERAEGWRQLLKESSETLLVKEKPAEEDTPGPVIPDSQGTSFLPAEEPSPGGNRVADHAVTDEARKTAGLGLEVDMLGDTARPGEAVEIVWSSPDGTVWKRVIDRPFTVQEVHEDAVRITVTAEEREAINSAGLSGKVFAVHR
jgi:hypothetical protein